MVYAGRLDETKGTRLLMAGWDRYRAGAAGQGLRLVIAGSGPLQDEVAAWASARSSIDMVRQVSSTRCAELLSRARAVLLPSVWEETFGLVAVEAMAAGTPPTPQARLFPRAHHLGGRRVLFRPGDPTALALAIADAEARPEQYEAYGDQARKTYEQRFDPQDNLEQLLEIYRYAVAHPV